MAHKTFISYKYSESQELRDRIIQAMGSDAASFKIVPLIYGKNFFTPVILGVIKSSPKQKSLEITFVDSPHMKVVKIILFTLLLGTIFAFSESKDIICVFPLSLSLVIFIFFLLFNHHAKNDAALTISKSISLMM